MSLERRLQRLETRMAPSPDHGPSPLCTCYPAPPTFRNQTDMDAALQQHCPQHGPRFRFCLVAPLTLSEEEWKRRQGTRPPPDGGV